MKMWSAIEFRNVHEAIRWRTVVVLQRSTSDHLRLQTIITWLLNLDADFFYAGFDTLVYTVRTNTSITRMTEWRSNIYQCLSYNLGRPRWPSGKVSTSGPEGRRFETRFH
ncbi:hypothetical protein AVEN_134520-1 [Araneus ventricosus]|uniref:Uncharacterized protein n=1 Tax=Araneus ventricosus TaxID=182803 RepID=A0A4Y2J103_ARAVE|nr:hypothetical protein AVEN_134520-1 [Araneus ventricosus]